MRETDMEGRVASSLVGQWKLILIASCMTAVFRCLLMEYPRTRAAGAVSFAHGSYTTFFMFCFTATSCVVVGVREWGQRRIGMNEMKLVESCFRNMGLTRRQVKVLSDKIAEYIASNRAAGISGEMDDSRQEYHSS